MQEINIETQDELPVELLNMTGGTSNFLDEERFEYRMYVLSLRHLSSINKACQGIHACLEYSQMFHDEQDYQQYVEHDKTLIMLDGGTASDMDDIITELQNSGVNYAVFREPDLYNLPTSICFLADERVWDNDRYMQLEADYIELTYNWNIIESSNPTPTWLEYIGGEKNAKLIQILEGKRLSI